MMVISTMQKKWIPLIFLTLIIIGGYQIAAAQGGQSDLSVNIEGKLNKKVEDKEYQIVYSVNFTVNGTMKLRKEKHSGLYENYEIEEMQVHLSHLWQYYTRKPERDCPEMTLKTESRASGLAPVKNGRLIIRYPTAEARRISARESSLDFFFSPESVPGAAKVFEKVQGHCQYRTHNFPTSYSVELVDNTSKNFPGQTEFSGFRSYGLSNDSPCVFRGSCPFTFNDNEKQVSIPKEMLPKELENLLNQRGGSVNSLKRAGFGFTEGNDIQLTWMVRKIKHKEKGTEPAKKKDPCAILTTRLLVIDAIIKAYSDENLFKNFNRSDGKISDAKRADMYQEAVQKHFNELMNYKEAGSNVKTLLTANGSTLTITYGNVIVVNTDGAINLPGYNEAMNGFIADCGNRSAGISLFNAALVHEKDHIENFRQGKWGDDPQGLRDLELSAYRKERGQLLKDLEIMRKRGDCK